MTRREFELAKERITVQYQEDIAALDRAFQLMNSGKSPTGGGALTEDVPSGAPRGRRAGAAPLTEEEKKARKKAYMKDYWARRNGAGGKAKKPEYKNTGDGTGIKNFTKAEFEKQFVKPFKGDE